MYIKIDNYNFQVIIKQRNTPIYIERKIDDYFVLIIPMGMREDELLQYLKINVHKLIKAYELKPISKDIQTLKLYDEDYICIFKENIEKVYRTNKTILRPTKGYNKKVITEEILKQDITFQIGLWEERVNCIIENIMLKSFKIKLYKCFPEKNKIEFNSSLKERKLSYIEFIVAKAVFDYLKIDENEQIILFDRYIENWKWYNKILAYEN